MDDGNGEGPRPLGVWDCTDGANIWFRIRPEGVKWAQAHIHDPDSTYRAEFYLIDAPFAVLYRFREDSKGRRHIDPATGEIAREGPVTQTLDALPPPHLLRDSLTRG